MKGIIYNNKTLSKYNKVAILKTIDISRIPQIIQRKIDRNTKKN